MGSVEREKETIRKMIEIYCWKKHGTIRGSLCPECRNLLDYAFSRLDLCPFKEDKPACRNCPIHCYRPDMRERIREVMRFSGPRLLMYAPSDWFLHKVREILSARRQHPSGS